jgi:hypothetical protein
VTIEQQMVNYITHAPKTAFIKCRRELQEEPADYQQHREP